jgi:hypothetical protein
MVSMLADIVAGANRNLVLKWLVNAAPAAAEDAAIAVLAAAHAAVEAPAAAMQL